MDHPTAIPEATSRASEPLDPNLPALMTISSDQTTPSLLIGIAGGSAGGKTSLARELTTAAGNKVAILQLDRFYHSLRNAENSQPKNFDEPAALDFELLETVLEQLRLNGTASVPKYDFATHTRVGYEYLDAAPVIIIEGILALWHAGVRDLLDFKLYVDAPAELRFQRRLKRDVNERGRDAQSVEQQWNDTVQPMHDKYVEPSQQYADRLISGTDNLKNTAEELLDTWTKALESTSK